MATIDPLAALDALIANSSATTTSQRPFDALGALDTLASQAPPQPAQAATISVAPEPSRRDSLMDGALNLLREIPNRLPGSASPIVPFSAAPNVGDAIDNAITGFRRGSLLLPDPSEDAENPDKLTQIMYALGGAVAEGVGAERVAIKGLQWLAQGARGPRVSQSAQRARQTPAGAIRRAARAGTGH